MREITTFPQKRFFLFLIDLAPHIIILSALEFYIEPKLTIKSSISKVNLNNLDKFYLSLIDICCIF